MTFLAAAQAGSIYGGSISATVLNIPGTPASAATALEGYPMTKRGEVVKALGVNVLSSFFGNTIGVILLLITMPIMVALVMKFGPWKMFWFVIFGVVIRADLSRANYIKGLIAASLGLLFQRVVTL
ncbi:MAG: tripartite tricarboxylate transporter permease [Thermoanaerobacteraceae bacterium]|nr:tripartite tricarboxylate transporter permease [Thermoanaerobacteraceae bacterium]